MGFGGLPHPDTGKSELETARTPNLDVLASQSALGLTMPVGYGVTPGSGPGHLALFGYDPLQFDIGRGVLEATGIGFQLGPNDVAARGNFCTLDAAGRISDRRAARIPTEQSAAIVERIRAIAIEGLDLFVEPVREHRFVLVLRGPGLSDQITETDPQSEGVAPLLSQPRRPDAARTAAAVNDFVAQAAALIRDEPLANGLVLRGLRDDPQPPPDGRRLGPQRRQLRHLSHVPRPRPLGRHDRPSPPATPSTTRSPPSASTGLSTTTSSATTSTPTPPARTETSTPRSSACKTSMQHCPPSALWDRMSW